MSAATAETAEPTVAVLSAPSTTRLYLARRADLELVLEKDPWVLDGAGEKQYDTGRRVKFKDGVLRVPAEGHVRGTRNELIEVEYVIRKIEGGVDPTTGLRTPPHPMFDDREEGFWLHQEAAPLPSESETDAIVLLAEESDVEGLDRLIDAERQGWAREDFLRVAEGARDRAVARVAKAEAKVAGSGKSTEAPASPSVEAA